MRQLILWHKAAGPHCRRPGDVVTTTPADDATPALDQTERLAQALVARLHKPVALTLTRNRSTMVSYSHQARGIALRLHTMFSGAPDEVVVALCAFVGGDKAAGRLLDRFIAAQAHQVQAALPPLRPRGIVFNLRDLFDEANQTYFHGACQAHITWGRARRPQRRTIQLGLYTPAMGLITINPVLDQSFVPRFYIAFIVFHEMLHELFGCHACESGRRRLHPPEFRLVESTHPEYSRCMQWEARNLHKLLRTRRHQQGVRKAPPRLLTTLR